ncbi:MAG: aminotransferase class V-fold PLP-dependent enzyme, partial [Acidaminobacteraceae bacterium]
KLQAKGITITRITCDDSGKLDTREIESAINEKTKLIVMTHCSNVSGSVVDLEAVGKISKANDLYFVVDAAQTSGVIDVDMQKLNADAVCFTGHKSLLGPQGIGGFIINDRMHPLVDTFIEGGTGSLSESEEQPDYMPDKFESGTPNIIGIYGLNASLKYINKVGKEGILKHEMHLVERFLSGIRKFEKIKIIGRQDIVNRLAVISVNFYGEDNSEIAHVLSSNFGIATRVGLHCAPSAHKTFGTYETGTVRFSFSSFNTDEEIDYTLDAIGQIMESL